MNDHFLDLRKPLFPSQGTSLYNTHKHNPNLKSLLSRYPLKKIKDRRSIWKARLNTVYSLLLLNYNIFLTDIDAIWIKKYNLSEILPDNVDVFNAYASNYPRYVFKKWGFVVCGGLFGVRSTEGSREFFKFLVEKCDDLCDDQDLINQYYLREVKMDWKYQESKYFDKIGRNQKGNNLLRENGLFFVCLIFFTTPHKQNSK